MKYILASVTILLTMNCFGCATHDTETDIYYSTNNIADCVCMDLLEISMQGNVRLFGVDVLE